MNIRISLLVMFLLSYLTGSAQLTSAQMYESLQYATYLGGEDNEEGWPKPEVLEGPDGTFYLAGLTKSADFLADIALINRFTANRYNLFVCLIHPDSSSILAGAILGPVAGFRGVAMEMDLQGNIVVGGFSSGQGFESHGTGYRSQPNGGTDAVLFKLNGELTEVIKQTCFGGSGDDELYGISMIASSLYLIGTTKSDDLPVHNNAFQENLRGAAGGEPDLFVARFDPNLNLLLGCTYLGGSGLEAGYLSKNQDAVLIAGFTGSDDYPVTDGAYDSSFNGFFDVILTRLSDDLTEIEASTYVGGSGGDFGYDCAIKDDYIYFTGHGAPGFPVTQNAYDRTYNGGPGGYDDAIVGKIKLDLTNLEAATFLGGNQFDNGTSVLIDSDGDVLIGGYTSSSNYPVIRNGWDQNYGGETDLFITTLKPDLSDLTFSSFIGGNGEDREVAMMMTEDERLIVVSETESTDLLLTDNPLSNTLSGNSDLALFIFGELLDPLKVLTPSVLKPDFRIHYRDQQLYLQFTLPDSDQVDLVLYDMMGKSHFLLSKSIPSAESNIYIFPLSKPISPGIYFGVFKGSNFSRPFKIGII